MRHLVALLALSILTASCARFNKTLSAQDRLIVTSSAGNFVKAYGVNSSSGALTLQSTITITSPTYVATHPTSGAFVVSKNNATLECYKYDMRRGTGPTASSSTAITNISALAITNDGSHLIYGRLGNNTIYWRSISDCVLGSESSLATGGYVIDQIIVSSDSTFVLGVSSGQRIVKFTRNTTSGTLVVSAGVNYSGGTAFSTSLTPDDRFILTSDGGASSSASYRVSDLALLSSAVGPAYPQASIALSATRAVVFRVGLSNYAVNFSSTGTITAGAQVDYGEGDFLGGIAYAPSRSFFYTGDQGNTGVWTYKATTTGVFSDTPTMINIGDAPDALAYLPGYGG